MIIGVTGWFASGKDTVADYLVSKGFKKFSLADIIREYLTEKGEELTRDNLRNAGNYLRETYGPNYLAAEAVKRIKADKEKENFVVPAVRQPAEVAELKKSGVFQLWEVYAPEEVRYQRMLARARSADEKNISFQDFIEKQKAETGGGPNCQQIDKVILLADQQIDNSGTVEELSNIIDNALEEIC